MEKRKSILHCALLGLGCLAYLNGQALIGAILVAAGGFLLFKKRK
ncbi:LPXTG cell wall anchor domain-containing protein [Acidaminococcus timonensis]|nr:LPXTG cell wall anchor domain-containing protein [Acidaminococcus timonensis]